MKKIVFYVLLISIITIIIYGFHFKNDEIDWNTLYSETNPSNINEIVLDFVDYNYEELELTSVELSAIKYYQDTVMTAVTFDMPLLDDTVLYNGVSYNVGVHPFAFAMFEKVFDIKIEATIEPFSVGLNNMYDNKYDFSLSLKTSPERLIHLNLEPYELDIIRNIYTKDQIIMSIEDLRGKKIALYQGGQYIYDNYLEFYDIEAVGCISYDECIDLVNDDEVLGVIAYIEYTFLDAGLTATNITAMINEFEPNFGSNKENQYATAMISAFRKAVDYSEINLFQLYHDLIIGYYVKSDIAFTKDMKEFIETTKENPISIVAYTDNQSSIRTYYLNSELKGQAIERLIRVFNTVGIEYEVILKDNAKEAYLAVTNKEYDILTGVHIIDERKKEVLYFNPYAVTKMALVGHPHDPSVNTELDIYKLDKIGLIEGSSTDLILSKKHPEITFIKYSDFTTMLDDFTKDEINYIIFSDFESYEYYLHQENYYDLDYKFLFPQDMIVSSALRKDGRGEMIRRVVNRITPFINVKDIEENNNINKGFKAVLEKEKIKRAVFVTVAILIFVLLLSVVLFVLYRQENEKRYVAYKQSKIDGLTNLGNLSALFDNFTRIVPGDGYLIYADINNFKEINEVYGHLIGDEILINFSSKICSLGSVEHAYRIGGDEFVVCGTGLAEEVVGDIQELLADTFKTTIKEFKIEASMGVVLICANDSKDISELISLAEYAMLEIKRNPKENVLFVDESTEKIYDLLIKVEKNINNFADYIVPVFQPLVKIENESVIGMESLMRFKFEGKLYYPEEVIPMFERNAKLHYIDYSMFDKSVEFLSEIKKKYPSKNFFASSNFSPYSLERLSVSDFEEIIKKYKVDKNDVLIEVTESAISSQKVINLVQKLAEAGFVIVIDDFAAGHSTLTLLSKMKVCYVKIDKSIALNIFGNGEKGLEKSDEYIIFKNLVLTMKELNKIVILEGIENKMVLELAAVHNVDIAQGFYYSKPISKDDFLDLM